MGLYYLLFIVSIVITLAAQVLVNSRYKKFSKIENSKKLSGAAAALDVLKKNGLDNVYVVETKGFLSDHFDPSQNVVRLSSDVYHGESISSVAIALHEVGHAIQYKEGNFFMKLRKFIFPVVNLSSKFGYLAIMLGFIFGIMDLVVLGIVMLVAILFFQLVTLPVEFDASRKAMSNIEKYNILVSDERKGAFKVLGAAALTYVAGLVTTLIEIFQMLLLFVGDRD